MGIQEYSRQRRQPASIMWWRFIWITCIALLLSLLTLLINKSLPNHPMVPDVTEVQNDFSFVHYEERMGGDVLKSKDSFEVNRRMSQKLGQQPLYESRSKVDDEVHNVMDNMQNMIGGMKENVMKNFLTQENVKRRRSSSVEKSICLKEQSDEEIMLLIVITTKSENGDNRDMIRKTWAGLSAYNTDTMRYVFMMENHHNAPPLEKIEKENEEFSDVINGSSSIHGVLEWHKKYCEHARFIMKVDDTTFVNSPRLVRWLRQNDLILKNNLLGLNCMNNESIPLEDKDDWKNFIQNIKDKVLYQNDNFYPPMCSSKTYIISGYVARHFAVVTLPKDRVGIFQSLDMPHSNMSVEVKNIDLTLGVTYSKKDAKTWLKDLKGGAEIISFESVPIANMSDLWKTITDYSSVFYLFFGRRNTNLLSIG